MPYSDLEVTTLFLARDLSALRVPLPDLTLFLTAPARFNTFCPCLEFTLSFFFATVGLPHGSLTHSYRGATGKSVLLATLRALSGAARLLLPLEDTRYAHMICKHCYLPQRNHFISSFGIPQRLSLNLLVFRILSLGAREYMSRFVGLISYAGRQHTAAC